MSNNRIRFDGMAELKAALRNLPKRLTEEATNIVEHTAQQMKDDVQAGYRSKVKQEVTGNLVDRVVISRQSGGFVTGAVVKNNAPHAYIFEHGTQVRQTDLGYNRGRMPPGRVWIPIAVRSRREMLTALVSMVERNGLTVTGNAI